MKARVHGYPRHYHREAHPTAHLYLPEMLQTQGPSGFLLPGTVDRIRGPNTQERLTCTQILI